MTIERLNDLKLFVSAGQSVLREASNDLDFRKTIDSDADDVKTLIEKEIHRIESQRKVKLLPCKCGRKRPEQWHKYIKGEGREGFIYQCVCGVEGKAMKTDREARLAWNKAVSE